MLASQHLLPESSHLRSRHRFPVQVQRSSGDVSLHGVQAAQATYEWIYDHANDQYAWRAQDDLSWDGQYFCFYDNGAGAFLFSGTCEPAPPPPPEDIFWDEFESE